MWSFDQAFHGPVALTNTLLSFLPTEAKSLENSQSQKVLKDKQADGSISLDKEINEDHDIPLTATEVSPLDTLDVISEENVPVEEDMNGNKLNCFYHFN